jgi:TRAP transporter TAXI family solute receptor
MQRYAKELIMLAAAIGLLLLGIYWLRPSTSPRLATLKMTAGDASGLRHKLALELAKEASRHGMTIDVQPTLGSEAALEGLKNGEFDLAFVQGGLSTENILHVRQLTAMHIEPLHLLVRAELGEQIAQIGIRALAGREVNVGPVGSGTQVLASEVLKFAGLDPSTDAASNTYRPASLSYCDLMNRAADGLPDAIFTVSSLPSPQADFLIETCEYQLVPLPFGEALALEAFLQFGDQVANGTIDKRHLFETRIPAFTYSVNRAEPPEPVATIGTRLLLAANERVPNEVVHGILEVLYNANFALAERPPLDATLLDLPSEFPLHPGSLQYRTRNKPLIAGDAIDYWEKVLAIAATVAGGTFFLVQWYLRWSRRKRETNFANYMERVLAIETAAMETELSAKLDLGELIRLQRELADLKSEAVRKFASGQLEGEGLIHGFLALVNDTRNQLTRLILHQRDNIEEQAALQHLDADKVWTSQAKEND